MAKKRIDWSLVVAIIALLWTIGFGVFEWVDAGTNSNATEVSSLAELREIKAESQANNKALVEMIALANRQLEAIERAGDLGGGGVEVGDSRTGNEPSNSNEEGQSGSDNGEGDAGQLGSGPTIESPEVANVGEQGWIYVGRWRNGGWDPRYSLVIDKSLPLPCKDDYLEIRNSVGFNGGFPEFPRWEGGLTRIAPYALAPGTAVEVLEVHNDIGWRNFTWAQVKIVDPKDVSKEAADQAGGGCAA